tara:strand:+ start:859 stop:1257 length:399 start_codon:yes stop_codon:yes gene_type:complete
MESLLKTVVSWPAFLKEAMLWCIHLLNKVFVMKKLAFIGLLALSFSALGEVDNDCTWKGIKLYGKVKVVTSFPDLEVEVVNSFPDLKVKKVNSFADRCGEWKFVESFPDFTVKFVNSFPDIKIKYVNSFPGV